MTTTFPTAARRTPARLWCRATLALLAVVALAASGYGLYRYATYPAAPDAATADAATLKAFLASDDFNRLTEADKQRLALAYVDRLRGKPFPALFKMMLAPDPLRKQMAANIRRMAGREAVGAAFLSMFLDRFDALTGAERSAVLTMMALAQQGAIQTRAEAFGLPSPDKFKRDLGRFLAHQPPRVQGQMGQMLIELKQQREFLHLPEPF